MRYFSLFTFIFFICTTARANPLQGVHVGDSFQQVEKFLGPPEMTESKGGNTFWGYHTSADICAVQFTTAKVSEVECRKNDTEEDDSDNALKGLGLILQGIGNGMSNPSRSVNCTTTGSPGYYTTTCH